MLSAAWVALGPLLRIAAAWAALGGLLLGLGLLARRALAGPVRSAADLPGTFWAGWALATGLLQIGHLFLPVGPVLAVALMALALAGVALGGRALWAVLRAPRPAWVWALGLAALAGVGLLVGLRALSAIWNWDLGLYYLQTVQWARRYPVVPGLGNLHGRLAFNSTQYLMGALAERLAPGVRAEYSLNTLLVLAAAAQIALAALRLLRGDRRHPLADGFLLLAAPGLIAQALTTSLTLSTDLTVWVLGMAVLAQLIGLLERRDEGTGRGRFALLAALAAAGPTVKLSLVVLGGFALLVALIATRAPARRWALAAAVGALLAVPWAARGAVLSGYPFYPVAAVSVPVEWRMPVDRVRSEAALVRAYARAPELHPDEALAKKDWVGPWWRRVRQSQMDFVVPLGLAGASALAAGALALARRPGDAARRDLRVLGLAAIPLLANVPYWFLTAPDPRFSGVTPWALAALGGLAVLALAGAGRRARTVALLGAAALLGLLALMPFRLPTAAEVAQFERVTVPPLRTTEIDGVGVMTPVEGGQCWGAPLPCAPYLRDGLHLRAPGDLRRGFLNTAEGG